ncbi:MAG TPA: hypothetical protein VGM82_24490 [Gemmatimonadaceae bacterium]|jgi:hypothetical protein
MTSSTLYRTAAVCLLLFAVGHTVGFSQADPTWKIDALRDAMRSIHFDAQGATRTYWDFFLGAGLTVGILYLLAAILAWQLSVIPGVSLAQMRVLVWAFALCFAGVTIVSWRYLFAIPMVFSSVITLCLTAAAWRSME